MKTKPDTIIEYGLIFLIIFTPLAFGSVHIWAYTIVEVVVLLLLLTLLFSRLTLPAPCSQPPAPNPQPFARSTEHGARRSSQPPAPCSPHPAPRSSFLAPRSLIPNPYPIIHNPYPLLLLLFLGLILFQMVPLPTTVIKHLSPNTYALYQQTLGKNENQGERIKDQGLRLKDKGLRIKDQGIAPSHLAPRSFYLNPYPVIPNPFPSPLAPRSLSIYGHATITEFLKFFVYISVFFLIITTMTTFRQIRRMALAIILTGTSVAFLAICQMLSKSDKIYGFWQSQYKIGSYGGPFINANHLAGYLEMVIPLALGFLVSREAPGIIRAAKNWKQRLSMLESWLAKNILLIFIIVLMSSALFLSVSRGGILSFVFSLGLFSLLLGMQKSQKGKRKMILLISGLIFIFLLWMGVGPVVNELATLADPKTASGQRPQVWKDTLALARDFPLFGVGLGNFQTLYPKYNTIATPTLWEHAHNDYVEMLADTGWVGLLLFFGGICFLLFTTIKKWKQRRDPFLTGITLGGFIGAISLLCHCVVEFNLHIPANAFLLFVILGLMVAAVNLKKRGDEEFFLLPVRTVSFSPKIRTALVMLKALVVVFLLTLVMKDYLGYRFFINYQSLASRSSHLADSSLLIAKNHDPRAMSLSPLPRAIFFDSNNAPYHYELGNYYARKMSESWKKGAWTLQGERWVFDAEKNTRFFGLKALQAYADAVNLSPANAWYHFYRGWTLSELKRLSDFSHHPIPLAEPCDAETEFSRALMLDPNNKDIKNYITSVKR